jgi:sugar O-acyltransferase (sialic acid O-acetyltransferase NeuD family)
VKLPLYRKSKRTLYIIGAGGQGISLASVAVQSGFRRIQFVETESQITKATPNSIALLKDLLPELDNCSFAIAIGDNFYREKVTNDLMSLASLLNVRLSFPNIIHPHASIGRFVEMGVGNQIFPTSNVGTCSVIQDFVILNHLSSVDHQSSCASYSSLAPGAVTGGNVQIGRRSAILISSSVAHQVHIGSDSVLAGNSFLKEDIADLVLYGGSPAKLIKNRTLGENYM